VKIFLHCTYIDEGTIQQMKDFVRKRFSTIPEDKLSATWIHTPSQSNPADLASEGNDPATLSSPAL